SSAVNSTMSAPSIATPTRRGRRGPLNAVPDIGGYPTQNPTQRGRSGRLPTGTERDGGYGGHRRADAGWDAKLLVDSKKPLAEPGVSVERTTGLEPATLTLAR